MDRETTGSSGSLEHKLLKGRDVGEKGRSQRWCGTCVCWAWSYDTRLGKCVHSVVDGNH